MSESKLPTIGSVIQGTYRVIEEMSVGDATNVYLCEVLDTPGEKVVMKALHGPRAGEDLKTSIKRFKNEVFIGYKISHPNVIHIKEFID